ncbi:MAG: glycosyltransferase [Caldimonas sp.]
MLVPALTFLTSLLVSFLLIRTAEQHGHRSADHDLSGPQKFHSRPVPRVGGVAIFAAILVGTWLSYGSGEKGGLGIWLLVASSVPTFAFGLAEDLTKDVSPRRRLFFTAVSASLAVWLLDAVIRRTAIPGIDHLLSILPFAVVLTVFAVTGIANAVNIIDGFNGLASMCVFFMLSAIAYVALQTGDQFVLTASTTTIGAVLGFFVWNFPAGRIFLGDGGAYLLGFVVAELSVLVMGRNAAVSPMFGLLLCAYPIFETVFTIYRRKFVRGVATAAPDGIHLHTLIHRRVTRPGIGLSRDLRQTRRNSMTSPYLWVLCLFSVIPSVVWWSNTAVLTIFFFLFMAVYVFFYRSIVHFKTPKWLLFRR